MDNPEWREWVALYCLERQQPFLARCGLLLERRAQCRRPRCLLVSHAQCGVSVPCLGFSFQFFPMPPLRQQRPQSWANGSCGVLPSVKQPKHPKIRIIFGNTNIFQKIVYSNIKFCIKIVFLNTKIVRKTMFTNTNY